MTEEKKEKSTGEDKTIIILDRGIVTGDQPGPEFACCAVAYFPLRW